MPETECGECGEVVESIAPALDAGHAEDCVVVQRIRGKTFGEGTTDDFTEKEAKVLHAELEKE
jgi:hypothetical protein